MDPLHPKKMKKYFSNLKKEVSAFPLMEEIKDLIKEEWKSLLKDPQFRIFLVKFCPFSLRMRSCGVDAALQRLARHVPVPIENSVTSKDPIDCCIDGDLNRVGCRC